MVLLVGIAILGLVLILLTRSRLPSYQECLTSSQTTAGAIICGLLGVDAIMRMTEPAREADKAEIKRLTKRLNKALAERDEARVRAESVGKVIAAHQEWMEGFLDEVRNTEWADDPVGDEFLRMFNHGVCGGGGSENYCDGDGEFLRPISPDPVPEARPGDS